MKNTLHLIFALAMLVSYTTLTALGHDATVLLGALLGQGAGAGVEKLAKPSG